MVGFHNVRIYTKGDNPWCESCINGEHITGKDILRKGGTVCFGDGIPTDAGCTGYKERRKKWRLFKKG